MAKGKNLTIESNKRLSESLLWYGQRHFYHHKGIDAWTNDVPFYITSNPYIAHCYANIIVRYFQDIIKSDPSAAQRTFYIIELGAGSGQFSFYLIKDLIAKQKALGLDKIKLCYVMTDFTENNIEFWQKHETLQPYFDDKVLDCALFDMEKDKHINLVKSKLTLNSDTVKNPMIVLANYLFDSIIQDVFSVNGGKIHESLITLSTNKNNMADNIPKDWKQVKISHNESLITKDYYYDSKFNNILEQYREQLSDGYFSFPIGSLRGIQNLQKIASDKLLLITSDKSYTNIKEQESADFPELDFHGSFSLMVDYHAITEYFKQCDGDGVMQSSHDGITTCVFTSDKKLSNLVETSWAINNVIRGFSPSDYFNIYEHLDKTYKTTNSKALASYLCLSHWDPFIYQLIYEKLNDLLEKDDDAVIDYLVDNIHQVADNFYYLPDCEDVFFNIALMFYTVDVYDKAIEYYKLSKKHFGDVFETIYNLALCYFYQDDFISAIPYFKQALKLKPRAKEAKDLLKKAERSLKKLDNEQQAPL